MCVYACVLVCAYLCVCGVGLEEARASGVKVVHGTKEGRLVGILSKVQLNIRDHTAVLFMPSALQTSPGPEQEALSLDASGQSGS